MKKSVPDMEISYGEVAEFDDFDDASCPVVEKALSPPVYNWDVVSDEELKKIEALEMKKVRDINALIQNLLMMENMRHDEKLNIINDIDITINFKDLEIKIKKETPVSKINHFLKAMGKVAVLNPMRTISSLLIAKFWLG